MTNAHVTSLMRDDAGRVTGVRYRQGGEGEDIELPSASVVLTTGGTHTAQRCLLNFPCIKNVVRRWPVAFSPSPLATLRAPEEVANLSRLNNLLSPLLPFFPGYAFDRSEGSLLAKFAPERLHLATTSGPQATGDGVRLGQAAGAGLVDMDQVQASRISADGERPHRCERSHALARGSIVVGYPPIADSGKIKAKK